MVNGTHLRNYCTHRFSRWVLFTNLWWHKPSTDQWNTQKWRVCVCIWYSCVFDCVSPTCVYLPVCGKKFDRFACCAPSLDNFNQSGLTSECRTLRAFKSRPPVDLSRMAYLHLSPLRVFKQLNGTSKMQSPPLLLMRAADKRLPNRRASILKSFSSACPCWVTFLLLLQIHLKS